jgi:bile acid:Na+ symporter, BASS family
MQGDLITQVGLPAGLMLIMFSLGIGLVMADFRRVFAYPRAFLVGVLCHFILLPLVAFLAMKALGLTGAIAVGFMILAACPTGTTSNLLTLYARGDVALALSFTAFAGLVSIVTVPLIVGFALEHFMGAGRQVAFPAGTAMAQIFVILGLPVMLGMLLRARAPAFARRIEKPLATVALVAFVLIVAAAIAKHFALFRENTAALAPPIVAIMVVMLALGYGLSRAARVEKRQAVTVAIESSIQNVTLAIVIASTLLQDNVMMLPGTIYGVLMYFVAALFVLVARRLVTTGAPTSARSFPGPGPSPDAPPTTRVSPPASSRYRARTPR